MFFVYYVARVYFWSTVIFFQFHFYFCKQEIRYSSGDATQTREWNVNLNKNNTSENVALNKMFHPDERPPSFIFNVWLKIKKRL